ncbi:hypothetical protein L1049_017792 [Liquidambar formosana]|uniref:non-specific serine/threonine protein kinase n=1 Tax=Liquidambar formosana TaxID=63359 RepID=A0AAP0QY90_LIQFO
MDDECRGAWTLVYKLWFIFIPVLTVFVFTEESTVLASDIASLGDSEPDLIGHKPARRNLHDVAKESTVLVSDITLLGDSETELINHKPARRKLDDVDSSISIDCGIPEDFHYADVKTELHYASDAGFIDTGLNKNISLQYQSETLQRSLMNVRSFPQGKRNCYTIKPAEGKDTVYLIRASFMYGNYDDRDQLPEFELYVGVNSWDSVKFDNASHIVMKEIIHVPLMDSVYVCLLNTGSGTPFISALELRHFHDSSYRTQSRSLLLYKRLDVGSTGEMVRYKDDSYDRIWFPYNMPNCVPFDTPLPIDSLGESDYKLPSRVMKTAVKPLNDRDSLDFDFETGDSTLEFYVYMHFAELEKLQENQSREFDIQINGLPWKNSVVPNYLNSTTIDTRKLVRGTKLSFSISKTSDSSLPPILNAMEMYIVKDSLQAPTDQGDVDAIIKIKSRYAVDKTWQGDPCAPRTCWDGLNCTYTGYDPPRIISLDLSSRGLLGNIDPSFADLRELQYLDLSNNSLTGQLPDFLSELPLLRFLNLTGNKLSGSIPSGLMGRKNTGSLDLRVDKNPDFCQSPPCKKEKNFVVPLVAATVSFLAILLALVVYWRFKRKQPDVKLVVKSHDEEGSLESNNRHFTYSEVVSITNNFQTVIGKGGFGTVYHGYLADGTQVAVKMLSTSSNQGSKQFRTEAQFLMRVHHRNLASFVGYCNEGTNIGLIYEYMANGSLQQHLSDKTKNALSWKERLQIAVDVAHGLEYLHYGCKPPIIHRDVKSANILLNEDLQAKIADFGFSRDFPLENESHLSTAVVGTFGYLDPEYFSSNRLTEKSDVYSFGIVLLELITGRPAILRSHENTHIVDWVSPNLARGDIRSIVDPRLQGSFDTNSVWKALETAMACLPSISIQRPTMTQVLIELKECSTIEIAHDETWRMEGNTFETNSVDPEIEMGPQAR